MFNIQTALDERLAYLKKHKNTIVKNGDNKDLIKKEITATLRQAGIINKNDKFINKVKI